MLWEIVLPLLDPWIDYRNYNLRAVENGTLPLAKATVNLNIVVFYLLATFGLQKFMQNRSPVSGTWLKGVIFFHNMVLSSPSLGLLVLFVEHVLPLLQKKGLYFSCCDRSIIEDNKFVFLSYINYLLKYYELIDTLFLVFKKKELQFLHVYHHALTLMLCQIQLTGYTSIQWIPITLNLFVHVLMYYYYAIATFGYDVWWKKYLTALQIIQFVIDIIFCWGAIFLLYGLGIYCHGDVYAAFFGSILLSSYLLLFVDFFTKKYDKKEGGKEPQPKKSNKEKTGEKNNHHKKD